VATQLIVSPNMTTENREDCRSSETRLDGAQVAAYVGKLKGHRLEVTSGAVWVTQSGDTADYILSAGAKLTITHPGMVVIQPARPGSASFCWAE
jgi:Protein of unknown function (DUF2917)